MPFTVVFMRQVNTKLSEKAKSYSGRIAGAQAAEAVAKDETIDTLIERWRALCAVRSVMVGLGALCAFTAMLESPNLL